MKISFKQKLEFFQEISSIYSSGFTLSDSLENLGSTLGKEIKLGLKTGKSLSEALSNYHLEPETLMLLQAGE